VCRYTVRGGPSRAERDRVGAVDLCSAVQGSSECGGDMTQTVRLREIRKGGDSGTRNKTVQVHHQCNRLDMRRGGMGSGEGGGASKQRWGTPTTIRAVSPPTIIIVRCSEIKQSTHSAYHTHTHTHTAYTRCMVVVVVLTGCSRVCQPHLGTGGDDLVAHTLSSIPVQSVVFVLCWLFERVQRQSP